MTAWLIANIAPLMFCALIVTLLIGFPVAFSLGAVGILFGLIGIEQAYSSRVFSIAALLFLPPTLIAGVYGMNFDVLPELHWGLGYPFALGLMLVSVLIALGWIKWRGWL